MSDIQEVFAGWLTAEQRAAAQDPAREVLCLACAGSGKSRTLAFRIAYLIARGQSPSGIVAFTFTEKAADAIKRQVAKALDAVGIEPTVLGAMFIGTIHSYCQHVLTQMDVRYRQFDVLDDNRLKLYLISRYYELGLHSLQNARNARYFDTVKETANAWKTMNDELIPMTDVEKRDKELGRVLTTLKEHLDRDQFIDFSLMVRLVVEALQRKDPGALRVLSQVDQLMVDEYQDVNRSQEELIRGLHGLGCSLFVVGDDDQAIYGWRGADVTNILEFSRRYPTCSSHTLSHNFRSTEAIVTSAAEFAAAELSAKRIAKTPSAENPPGPRDFRVLWFKTRKDEADWVAERIRSLLGTEYREKDGTVRGLTPGDFAILMRSTRQNERDGSPRHKAFTLALERRGIQYTLEAGGGVFERRQVIALRECFRLLRNRPSTRGEAMECFERFVRPAFPTADFERFADVLTKWGSLIHRPRDGERRRVYPQKLVYDLLSAFRIDLCGFDSATMRDIGVFSRIMQDVEAVYVSIDSAQRFREIVNFLDNMVESGYDTGTEDLLLRPDAVTVSTVHKVKGLEFPVVFVADVESGRFPGQTHGYSGWLPREAISDALARGAYRSTAFEEARLFYTALTRAERYLYVTGSARLPGGTKVWSPSPFSLRLKHPELSDNPEGMPEGIAAHCPVPRVDEAVMPTTYSDIRYYLCCPRDYQFRKAFGFSPPIAEMFGFGMTVHTAVSKLHEVFLDAAPASEDARTIAREVFHLKHVPPSKDPEVRPGPYERARERAEDIIETYARTFSRDFAHRRQVEVRFEIPVRQAVIAGSIDLILHKDEAGNIIDASVIDFKTLEGGEEPEGNPDIQWTELALQVQLYAKAARDVLGEDTRTGAVHLLKDNRRVQIPVDDAAVQAAVENVEWAVDRILAGDFPMRPHRLKCSVCDFRDICSKVPEGFKNNSVPPPIRIPGPPDGCSRMARAFSEFEGSPPSCGDGVESDD